MNAEIGYSTTAARLPVAEPPFLCLSDKNNTAPKMQALDPARLDEQAKKDFILQSSSDQMLSPSLRLKTSRSAQNIDPSTNHDPLDLSISTTLLLHTSHIASPRHNCHVSEDHQQIGTGSAVVMSPLCNLTPKPLRTIREPFSLRARAPPPLAAALNDRAAREEDAGVSVGESQCTGATTALDGGMRAQNLLRDESSIMQQSGMTLSERHASVVAKDGGYTDPLLASIIRPGDIEEAKYDSSHRFAHPIAPEAQVALPYYVLGLQDGASPPTAFIPQGSDAVVDANLLFDRERTKDRMLLRGKVSHIDFTARH